MKKFILLLAVAIAVFTSCSKVNNNPTPKDRLISVLLGKDTLNMYVGQTRVVPITLNPTDYHLDSIKWKSSDTTILTVTNTGFLTAKKTGVSILTVSNLTNTVSSSAIVTVGAAPVDSLAIGLIAYYPFTGNAIDSTGHGYNGTVNGATLTTGITGTSNSAYHFDGVTQNIGIADATALRLSNTDFTINAWVKLDQFSTTNGSVVYSKRLGTANDGFDFSVTGDSFAAGTNHPGNTPGLITFGPGGPYDNEWGINQITISNWYMVTVVYSFANKQITSYINGVYDAQSDNNVVSPSSQAMAYIGSDNPGNGLPYYFQGSIDNLRIYGRALTKTELGKLYLQKR
jgi:hypothetical protein